MRHLTKKYSLLIFGALISVNVLADSTFECSSPTSNLEQLICGDANLNQLNARSNDLYIKSKQFDSSASSEINKTLYFNSRKCNDDLTCISSGYQDAINAYQEIITKNTPVIVEDKISSNNPIQSDQVAENKPIYSDVTSWFSSMSWGSYLLIISLIIFVIYFLPTIIAFNRNHRNRWVIFLINIVFGATLIGWLIALIWSMNKIDDPVKGGAKYDRQRHDPTI